MGITDETKPVTQIDLVTFNDFIATDLPFCTTMGIKAVAVGHGWGQLRWGYDANYTRPPDFVCGPIMMALADASLYLALFSIVGIEPQALTNELKTNFLRPARGQDLVATAKIIKMGRRVVYGAVEVCEADDLERIIAHATGSYVRPEE